MGREMPIQVLPKYMLPQNAAATPQRLRHPNVACAIESGNAVRFRDNGKLLHLICGPIGQTQI